MQNIVPSLNSPLINNTHNKYKNPTKYEYKTISAFEALCFFIIFSWKLPISASQNNEELIKTIPGIYKKYNLKT